MCVGACLCVCVWGLVGGCNGMLGSGSWGDWDGGMGLKRVWLVTMLFEESLVGTGDL